MTAIVFGSPEALAILQRDALLHKQEREDQATLDQLQGDTRAEKLTHIDTQIADLKLEIQIHEDEIADLEEEIEDLRALRLRLEAT